MYKIRSSIRGPKLMWIHEILAPVLLWTDAAFLTFTLLQNQAEQRPPARHCTPPTSLYRTHSLGGRTSLCADQLPTQPVYSRPRPSRNGRYRISPCLKQGLLKRSFIVVSDGCAAVYRARRRSLQKETSCRGRMARSAALWVTACHGCAARQWWRSERKDTRGSRRNWPRPRGYIHTHTLTHTRSRNELNQRVFVVGLCVCSSTCVPACLSMCVYFYSCTQCSSYLWLFACIFYYL